MQRLTLGRPTGEFYPPKNSVSQRTEGKRPPSPPPSPPRKIAPCRKKPPLFSLFNKDISGEDLLLLILILLLIQENADKLLIGALIYVFLG